MARTKVPPPPIPALRALEECYRRMKQIPDPTNISESSYISALSNELQKDYITEGKASTNFVNKFRSSPYQPKMEDAEGINLDKLQLIAQAVIKHYHLLGSTEFAWHNFITELFPTPEHLKHLDEKRYYKYLTDEEKLAVDGYVQRRLNEFGIGAEDIFTYLAFVWNAREEKTSVGIMQINRKTRTATYTYHVKIENVWVVKSVLRSDLFEHGYSIGGNCLYLSMRHENQDMSHIRMNVELAIHDHAYFTMPYLRGVFSSSTENGTIPVAGVITLKKYTSYNESFQIVKSEAIDSFLSFDTLTRRHEVNEQNLFAENRFRCYPLFQLLSKVAGAYRFVYIPVTNMRNRQGMIVVGNCFIEENGMVTIQTHNGEPSKYRVDNNLYFGSDNICFSSIPSDLQLEWNFQYHLKIYYDYDTDPVGVKYLAGIYAGIYKTLPVYGHMVFIPYRKDKIDSFQKLSGDIVTYAFKRGDEKTLEEKEVLRLIDEYKEYGFLKPK